MIRPSALGLALSLIATAALAQQTGQRMAFVSCPILRNTEPVPCWMAEFKGELYYLGPQGDLQAAFYPPQFNHRALVEGVKTDERFCGGIVLKNAKASVLPDIDVACNVILPAEGYAEHEGVRGSGPSGDKETRTAEGGVGGARRGPPPPAPQPPFTAKEFTANFDADTERLWRQAQGAINDAVRYANASKARTIEITGYRAAIKLADGKDYIERPSVAHDRAKTVEEAIRNVGVPAGTKLVVKWAEKPSPSTGTDKDAEARKTVIVVRP